MPATIYKTFMGKVVSAKKDGPIVAVVSTEDVDGIGDIVMQGKNEKGAGWLLDDYNKKNGRVYWMHNPFQPNLAKASARVVDRQLLLTVEFDMADEYARELDRKYREGFLSEWSVGYLPMAEKYDTNEHGGVTYYEQSLGEVSAVNEGMNPSTETTAKAFSKWAGWGDAKITERIDALEAGVDALEINGLVGNGLEHRVHELETQLMRAVTAEDALNKVIRDGQWLAEWKRNIRGTA